MFLIKFLKLIFNNVSILKNKIRNLSKIKISFCAKRSNYPKKIARL